MKYNGKFYFLLVCLLLFGMLNTGFADEAINLKVATYQWSEKNFDAVYGDIIIPTFESEYPNVTVEKYNIPSISYWDKMAMEIAAGIPADVVAFSTSFLSQYINDDLLEPIDKWVNIDINDERLIASHEYARKDGKLYGIAINTHPRVLMYNKKMFDQYNVKVPTTPEEFVDAAQKLTDAPYRYGFAMETTNDPERLFKSFIPFVLGFGGHVAKEGVLTVDSPEVIKALQLYKEFLDKNLVPRDTMSSALRQMFWEEKIGMLIDGQYVFGLIKAEQPEIYPSIAAALIPFEGPAMSVSIFLTIPKDAKHKKEAGEFLEVVLRQEMQEKQATIMGTLPAYGKYVVPESYIEENTFVNTFLQAAEHSATEAPPGLEIYAPYIIRAVGEMLNKVLYLGVEPAEAAKETQKDIENYLKEN